MLFQAKIIVTLKNGVLDPQGKAIEGALSALSFDGVSDVRQGKVFELSIEALNQEAATAQIGEMCEKLLANTVIEDYAIEIVGQS